MAEERLYSRDILLILEASFFYFSCPMLVTPIITGFSGSLGASAALMGLIGGMMNLCSLFCRPFAGNLADKIDKSRLSIAGTWMMAAACLGYMLALDARVVAALPRPPRRRLRLLLGLHGDMDVEPSAARQDRLGHGALRRDERARLWRWLPRSASSPTGCSATARPSASRCSSRSSARSP